MAYPHHHANNWTQHTAERHDDASPVADNEIEQHLKRQAFHHAKTSLGVAGHWIHLVGGLLPLALSELISDQAKYRKAVRFAAIGTTLAYETLYTFRERKRREEQDAKLAECRSSRD